MYFIANWKMFGGFSSLNSLNKVIKFLRGFKNNKIVKIIYCPPSTLINAMSKKLKNTKIEVGSQNCHENENYGAFTGSINSKILKDAGAKYIIIGHSENRQTGENDELINKKIKSALKLNLRVIFCIGEKLVEKKKKITKRVLKNQINLGLRNIKNKNKILIAYEPVWSIGTGLIPKSNELFNTVTFIKKNIKK